MIEKILKVGDSDIKDKWLPNEGTDNEEETIIMIINAVLCYCFF